MISTYRKCPVVLLMLLFGVVAGTGLSEDNDVLIFENGDNLHGRLESVSSEKGLVWTRQDTASPTILDVDSILRVKMGMVEEASRAGSSLRLTNKDVIVADLVSLDATNVVVKTLQAGELTISRAMLASITPGKIVSTTEFAGPSNQEEWTITPPTSWVFKNNALYSKGSGTFGRDMNLPDMASIEMDVAWQAAYPQFRFAFYTDTITSYSGNNYCLRPSSSYIRLYRSGSSSGMPYATWNFAGKRKARFQMLVNKKAKTVTLLMDGEMVTTWTEAADFAGKGGGIALYAYSSPLKVSNIRISSWDGTMPRVASGGREVEEDVIELSNGDKITGNLKVIQDSKVSFDTSYATLSVPFDRVAKIALSSEKAERARRYSEDVRIHFAEGSMMTVKVESIEDGVIRGVSENFGQASLDLKFVQHMDLNLYRERDEDEEEGW